MDRETKRAYQLVQSTIVENLDRIQAAKKAKVKLSARKYNPSTRKHEVFVEKKLPPHSK